MKPGIITTLFALSSLCACSLSQPNTQELATVASSGTIIISGSLPSKNINQQSSLLPNEPSLASTKAKNFAPLLGYAKSGINYSPASNEYSLEISRSKSNISVKLGDKTVEVINVEGALYIDAGRYLIQRKENSPSWYAPNEYYSNRELPIPFAGDAKRFRRGALGNQALFGSSGLIIHSSPVWTPEVGGIRVEASRLSSLTENLSVGSVIEVK